MPGRRAPTPRRETRRKEQVSDKRNEKRYRGAERETPRMTPTRATDVLIGDEEQREKNKSKQKQRNRERTSNPVILDRSVASYNPHGPYSEPILLPHTLVEVRGHLIAQNIWKKCSTLFLNSSISYAQHLFHYFLC